MQVINRQLLSNIENLYNAIKTQIALITENKRTYSNTVTASQAVTLANTSTGATASAVEPTGPSSNLRLINATIY